jgi:molybdopterin-guanine dinucleotide biosynthesis protein A
MLSICSNVAALTPLENPRPERKQKTKNSLTGLRDKMFKLDGMLMIGSAGTKVGKTELACALIKRFSNGLGHPYRENREIVGIKVTTIKAKDGTCPRGGRGCGVCSSLEGGFYITEETNKSSGKDTGRLLAAGASRVFWLRVMKTHLQEGIKALLKVIGRDAVSVCESNSLREVVKPGLFLIVKGRNDKRWKSSAGEVKESADKIIVSDNGRFDFDLGRIRLINNRWIMQESATAIIMAGGDSSRMGFDKSMLVINGRPIIERISEQLRDTFSQILISANEVDKYRHLGFKVIPDRQSGQGPLMGIASALEASANEHNFVVACDIPNMDLRFIRRMLAETDGADIVVPTTGDGKYEPLFAVYSKSALRAINDVLSTRGRKISDVFGRCRIKYIEARAERFVNLNTMAEYEAFQQECDGQF